MLISINSDVISIYTGYAVAFSSILLCLCVCVIAIVLSMGTKDMNKEEIASGTRSEDLMTTSSVGKNLSSCTSAVYL